MIRKERLENLQTRKSQVVLDREIDKFKAQLEVNRCINKMPVSEYRRINNIKIAKEGGHKIKTSTRNNSRTVVKVETVLPDDQLQLDQSQQFKDTRKISKATPIGKKATHAIEQFNKNCTQPKSHVGKFDEHADGVEIKKDLATTTEVMQVARSGTKCFANSTHQEVTLLIRKLIRETLNHYWSRWKLFVLTVKNKRDEEKKWREKINSFMKRANERGFAETGKKPVKIMENKKIETVAKSNRRQIISRLKNKTKDMNRNE